MPAPTLATDSDTRAALLAAAAELFADQGFGATRVREIVARAKANLAAVNYHFGSKEGLYLAVLEHEAGRVIERYPITRPEHAGDAAAALRDVVAGLLARFLSADASSYAPRLLIREMLNPTPALAQVVEHVTRPQFEQVFAVVATILGPRVPPEQVRLCVFSVVGQCMFYLVARPVIDRLAPGAADSGRRETLADNIAALSLAGLQARRRQYEEATTHA